MITWNTRLIAWTVHGKEYGFGAHDFPVSGVFEVEPRSCPGFLYRTTISLGRINMSSSEFRTFIENMAGEYHGDTYHLISKNCNHFTDDVSLRLTGRRIPGWVNRLARLGTFIKFLLFTSSQSFQLVRFCFRCNHLHARLKNRLTWPFIRWASQKNEVNLHVKWTEIYKYMVILTSG